MGQQFARLVFYTSVGAIAQQVAYHTVRWVFRIQSAHDLKFVKYWSVGMGALCVYAAWTSDRIYHALAQLKHIY